MASSPIRLAMVGLDHWYWAFSIAESIRTQSDVKLVAVTDNSPERARSYATRFGIEYVAANPREIFDDAGIDAIASFISIDQNPAICIDAAKHGKHIFSVKPLARTLAAATEIRTAVRDAGIVFLPSESTGRLAAQNIQLKQWISEGRLGRILTATHTQHTGLPKRWPDDNDPGWFLDPDRAPGGGWIDHSIYHIDRLRWLLNDEIDQIGGYAGKLKYPELKVEDYGLALAKFKAGVIASIEVTWIAPTHGSRTAWGIVGTEGAVSYDSLSGRLSLAGHFPQFEGWVHTTPPSSSDIGLSNFVAAIRGEAAPIATVDDAWHNLAACVSFFEAAEAGTAKSLPTLPSS